jgi:hypothetical protein
MRFITGNEDYYCALLCGPSDLGIFTKAKMACCVNAVKDPSVDDAYAPDMLRKARSQGGVFWKNEYERQDNISIVLINRAQNHIAGISSIVMPTPVNELKAPLMCSAHILSEHRRKGLISLLIDASLFYIRDYTNYNDVHVMAHRDNIESILGLKKKGFYTLSIGRNYTTYIGRIPSLCPRKNHQQPTAALA